MIKRKKLLIYFLAGILLTLFLTTCHHFLNNLTVADRAKVKIAASNGEKFTIVYTLHNFPDESYSLEIRDKFGDAIGVFSGDGRGNTDVKIEYLCSVSNFDYYKAIHENGDVVYDELFVYNKKESFIIEDDKNHIAKHYDSILMFNDHEGDTFEIFIPAAKHQILNDNNGDYIGAYGERLIVDGNKGILEKIKFFVENPDVIKHDICSKEEIISRCQELLQKHGGEQ